MTVALAEHVSAYTTRHGTEEAALTLLWVVRVRWVLVITIRVGRITAWRRTLTPRTALRVVWLLLLRVGTLLRSSVLWLLRILLLLLLAVVLAVLWLLGILLLLVLRCALAVGEAAVLRRSAVPTLLWLTLSLVRVVGCRWCSISLRLSIRRLAVAALVIVWA